MPSESSEGENPQWGTDEWFWQRQRESFEIGMVNTQGCHAINPLDDFVGHFLDFHAPEGNIDEYREIVREQEEQYV